MGFSPDWLALREAADHRSRDAGLADRLATHLAQRKSAPRIIDIGCGTGSNLRALAPSLGGQQSWTLVDYDPILLKRAREALTAWADQAAAEGPSLRITKGGKTIDIAFLEADLVGKFEQVFQPSKPFDLLTASAFFDLASPAFIDRCARAAAEHRAAFYTVLTYNGVNTWTPTHTADQAMVDAFNSDQKTDKGLLGVAAGPDAPKALAQSFAAYGYSVYEADTPWVLADADSKLLGELVPGFAGACRKTGRLSDATVTDWLTLHRTAGIVGHTDTLALAK